MSVVWEEPPAGSRTFSPRERSPLRKEIEGYLDALKANPGQWARLWDFSEKEDAEKRTTVLRSVSGKGWNILCRKSDYGWSIYARRHVDEPEETTEREPGFPQ